MILRAWQELKLTSILREGVLSFPRRPVEVCGSCTELDRDIFNALPKAGCLEIAIYTVHGARWKINAQTKKRKTCQKNIKT